MTKAKPLFFFHIPKTAGSSMQWILAQHYRADDIAAAFTWTTLLGLNRKKLCQQKLFQGHFYGPLERVIEKQCFSFTILRDPIERALSHYGHVLRNRDHYLHQRAVELGNLDAYLEDQITRMTVSNFQSRMLALDFDVEAYYFNLTLEERANWYLERHIETTDFGIRDQALFTAAQAKLEKFMVVGITEKFPETLALLCYRLGWAYPSEINDRNVNIDRPRKAGLSDSTLKRLTELNEIDITLYSDSCSKFKKNISQLLIEMTNKNSKKCVLQRLFS